MRFIRRLAQWWQFRDRGAELEEELSFHREAIERDLIARGQSPEAARAAARRAMGNETLMREEARGVWLWPALEAVGQDAAGTLRSLRRSPAFTTGVMLTFALGVGANAAMFAFLDRLMLRPPALLRDPASVHRVYLYRTVDGNERQTGGQYVRHADLVRWTTAFSTVSAHSLKRLAVGVGQEARELPIGVVSASFFDFFEAPPVMGRYFAASEDSSATTAPVAVLTYAAWQERYAGRADAVGSTLQIGSLVYSIIGVGPKGFVGLWPLQPPVAFIPVSTYAASRARGGSWATNYGSYIGLETLVRRRPGVSLAVANADLTNAFTRSYLAQFGAEGDPSGDRLAKRCWPPWGAASGSWSPWS